MPYKDPEKQDQYFKEYYQKNKKNILGKNREYRKKNREKILKQKREYWRKNKKDLLKNAKIYYEKNKEDILKQCKEYKENNKEFYSKYNKGYRIKNKERIKEYLRDKKEYISKYMKQWREDNKKHLMEYSRKYNINWRRTEKGKAGQQRGSIKRREREKNIINTLTADEWRDIFKKYNFKCAYCGKDLFTLFDRPERDHIVPISKGGNNVKENIAPACRSCNAKKSDKVL